MKKIILAFGAFFLAGCAVNSPFASAEPRQVVLQKIDKEDIKEVLQKEKLIYEAPDSDVMSFFAVGEGIAPLNTVSPAQALALAKKAALADAYRELAGKLYGVKINAKDTVKDAMLRDSFVSANVNGLVKNASIVDEKVLNGLFQVKLELKISSSKWQEIFSY